MTTTEHRIYPHDLLRQLAPTLWQVKGSLPIPLSRNMTVYRMPDGKLLLYSVVAMNEAGMQSLEALGEPAVMVVPHPLHTMDAPFYKRRYPHIRVIAPEDAARKLAKHQTPVDAPPEALAEHGIRYSVVPGFRFSELVLDLDLARACAAQVPGPKPKGLVERGRALVLTDLIINGLSGGILMTLLGPPDGCGVARIVKLRQIKSKAAVRDYLKELAETPELSLVAIAHGRPLVGATVGDLLRQAAAKL